MGTLFSKRQHTIDNDVLIHIFEKGRAIAAMVARSHLHRDGRATVAFAAKYKHSLTKSRRKMEAADLIRMKKVCKRWDRIIDHFPRTFSRNLQNGFSIYLIEENGVLYMKRFRSETQEVFSSEKIKGIALRDVLIACGENGVDQLLEKITSPIVCHRLMVWAISLAKIRRLEERIYCNKICIRNIENAEQFLQDVATLPHLEKALIVCETFDFAHYEEPLLPKISGLTSYVEEGISTRRFLEFIHDLYRQGAGQLLHVTFQYGPEESAEVMHLEFPQTTLLYKEATGKRQRGQEIGAEHKLVRQLGLIDVTSKWAICTNYSVVKKRDQFWHQMEDFHELEMKEEFVSIRIVEPDEERMLEAILCELGIEPNAEALDKQEYFSSNKDQRVRLLQKAFFKCEPIHYKEDVFNPIYDLE